MGDFPSHLVRAPEQPRYGRAKATAIVGLMLVMCLALAGATPRPVVHAPAMSIAGLETISSPPGESSWAPLPEIHRGLRTVATAGKGRFALHTAGGDRTFLPGVNLGSTTPGHQPGELAIDAAQYRSWFAAMGWLGIRVVRVYPIHPPAFYQELARYNAANPDRPLYLMQGVYPPDGSATPAFQQELRDAAAAVAGALVRKPQRGRAGGTWTADVTPWLAGWIIGAEFDQPATDRTNQAQPAVHGRYFGNTVDATPTERWLAARMDELATVVAQHGLSQPIAFVNGPTPLDPNHIRPTSAWPAGTFASYSAYPYLQTDPYAAHLAALRRHDGDTPTLITEFGVPSSIGSAHNGPLGRSQGDHSERDAMQIDADLLRMIKQQGLSAGFLQSWADEWYASAWNTGKHQDAERRQLWHDPLTSTQNVGLIAMDAAGSPDATNQYLIDVEGAWPARRVTARVDESYVRLRIALGHPRPSALTLGFDVLPWLIGRPAPGTGNRNADAAFALDLVSRSGQAYLRDELDPVPLDQPTPAVARGPAAPGWKPFELVVDRAPIEIQNAGALRYGTPDQDSRALWYLDADDLVVRVPWALLGYADPSSHRIGVRRGQMLIEQFSPGVGVVVSAAGTDQTTGEVNWVNWNRPYYTERLKHGANQFRDAALDVT